MDASAATQLSLFEAPDFSQLPARVQQWSAATVTTEQAAPVAPSRPPTRPIAAWSNQELIGVIAGKRPGGAIDLPCWGDNLKNLVQLDRHELAAVLSVSPEQAQRIQAAFEVHRRCLAPIESPRLKDPESIVKYLLPHVQLDHERLWCIPFDSHLRPLCRVPAQLSQGETDGVDVNPRTILRYVLSMRASSFVIAHNHPAEEVSPSQADLAVTRRLAAGARAVDLTFYDHVVIARTGAFTSLRRMAPGAFVA